MLKRRLKEPFGKAGLTVAILALVMALIGGAYAAGGLTKSQEKQVTKIAKKYAGKPGAAGAPGSAGAAGTPGPAGAAGKNGKNGESVTISAASVGECPEGGSKFTVGSEEVSACNGSPWTAGGTLPKGETEQGMWSAAIISSIFGEAGVGTISFVIPLQSAPTLAYVNPSGEEVTAGGPVTPVHCHGTMTAPTAPQGFLCLYAESEGAATFSESGSSAHPFGARLEFQGGFAGGEASGSWAVTAG